MTDRSALIEKLITYSSHAEEKVFVPRFLKLLEHHAAFDRDHLPGHMTGSAWIVDSVGSSVLLVHHAKLQRWLQPGGHADGDENITNVAIREVEEETGLKNCKLLEPLFDIDIHEIPERKGFPAHDHYDVRCLLVADRNETLVISEESTELAWIPLDHVSKKAGNSRSISRMVEKTRDYFELISKSANAITTSQNR